MRDGRKAEILDLSERVLSETHQGSAWPVDLFDIARQAQIEIGTISTIENVDGRFEYVGGHPVIYLNLRGGSQSDGRVRFSLGHELGHYFLHRHLAREWEPHNDSLNFVSETNEREEEANFMASCLLLPRRLLHQQFKLRRTSADSVFALSKKAGASTQAASIAVAQATGECCLFLYEEHGEVKWVAPSDDWREKKFPWIAFREHPLPRDSGIGKASGLEEVEDPLTVWCPKHHWVQEPVHASYISAYSGKLVVLRVDFDNEGIDDPE